MVSSVIGVMNDFKRFFWPQKNRAKVIRLGSVALLMLVAVRFFVPDATVEEVAVVAQAPRVVLTSANQLAPERAGSYIGTVRAVSEAAIQSEVSGRVTSVRVRPGDEVVAGTIIATLENSAEQASVLQAEGSYESALAAAAISDIGVSEAQTSLGTADADITSTVRDIQTSLNSLYNNQLDTLVADADNVYRTGSVILASDRAFITAMEAAYQSIPSTLNTIESLNAQARTPDTITQLETELQTAYSSVEEISGNVRQLIEDDDLDDAYTAEENNYLELIAAVNSQVAGFRTRSQAAFRSYNLAIESLNRAELSASNNTVSAADAQVKSALGSLRAAQAQFAKTILRSPITGTVNTVDINTGDFLGAFTPVAEVANNGSLEVVFFVTDRDAAELTVGQTVAINQATGTIVTIAPAVDQATQKTEVRAAAAQAADLINGGTVTITPEVNLDTPLIDTKVIVPISAVRFTASDGFVFTVSEELTLEAVPVTLGVVNGSSIEIIGGISADTQIVADARGLTTGQIVTTE